MGFFINPILAIEENQHHSNYHTNWNWSHQQCIQCYVAYYWSHRRDIRSPVFSHLRPITVESGFLFFKYGWSKCFVISPPVYCSSIYLHQLTICHVIFTVFRWCLVNPRYFIVCVIDAPMVNHVNTSGEAYILRK